MLSNSNRPKPELLYRELTSFEKGLRRLVRVCVDWKNSDPDDVLADRVVAGLALLTVTVGLAALSQGEQPRPTPEQGRAIARDYLNVVDRASKLLDTRSTQESRDNLEEQLSLANLSFAIGRPSGNPHSEEWGKRDR